LIGGLRQLIIGVDGVSTIEKDMHKELAHSTTQSLDVNGYILGWEAIN
jgi:hypothetical protein